MQPQALARGVRPPAGPRAARGCEWRAAIAERARRDICQDATMIENADMPHEGLWWIPGEYTKRVGGILQLGQVFELRTMGDFSAGEVPPQLFTSTVLNGLTQKRSITLLGCRRRRSTFNLGAFSALTIGFDMALIGAYTIPNEESAVFDRVMIVFDNLTAWANRPTVQVDYESTGTITVRHSPHSDMIAHLPGGTVRLNGRLSGSDGPRQTPWETAERVAIELAEPLPVLAIEQAYVRPLRYLLNLATNETCNVKSLKVANSRHDHSSPGVLWFDVDFYQGKARLPEGKPVELSSMMFSLDDVDFRSVIPKWFETVEQIGLSLDLLFALSNPGNIFVSNRLFNAATALEGLHQKLYPEKEGELRANRKRVAAIAKLIEDQAERAWLRTHLAGSHRPFLRQRLDDLLERAGSAVRPIVGDSKVWTTKIKNLRDSIGHGADRSNDDLTAQVRLTATLELLYRSILLLEIGFSDQQCEQMVRTNRNWSYLPRVLREDIPDLFESPQ